MKLYLCPNVYNEKQVSEAKTCVLTLQKMGHEVSMSNEDASVIFKNESEAYMAYTPAESDLIVSLGGDGAVLKASKLAIREEKKLFGINSGRLGFLCALDFDKIDEFNACLEKNRMSERSLLKVHLRGKDYTAVNDVIVSKEKIGTSTDLTINVNNTKKFHVRGDGILIASPTGSTAYNYSAGGPILDSSLSMMVLTPLHSNQGLNHPFVTDMKNQIQISERNGESYIVVDGINIGEIEDDFTIQGSDRKLLIFEK